MNTSKTPGKILREAREKKGLTQLGVAEKVGLHSNTYAKIERDENQPSPVSIKKLVKVLGIEPSKIPYLLG